MERYKNLGGNSEVRAYEIGEDSLIVQFSDGWNYVYTNRSAGRYIEKMKVLAIAGQGLNSFIKLNVRFNYSKKYR